MANSNEAVREALEIQAESNQEVEAARAEQERGEAALSLDLLIKAIEKERASLSLLEQGVEKIKQGLENRREALDQQQGLLEDLVTDLSNSPSGRD